MHTSNVFFLVNKAHL